MPRHSRHSQGSIVLMLLVLGALYGVWGAGLAGDQGGNLTGAQYQKMRSDLARASRGSSDPALSRTLSDMAENLDDAHGDD